MISIPEEDRNELADFFESLTSFINDREKVNAILLHMMWLLLLHGSLEEVNKADEIICQLFFFGIGKIIWTD